MDKQKIILLFLFCCCICPLTAHAYIDPGAGSYLFQVSIGFLVGGVLVIKHFWRNIVDFFKNLFSSKKVKSGDERKK